MSTACRHLLTDARLLACVLLALSCLGTSVAQCPRTHPYVGFTGAFTSFEHDFGGTIRIIDDCTFQVTGFTYDGLAPQVAWYGARDVDSIDNGVQIVDEEVVGAANGETVTLTLNQLNRGRSWNDVGVVYLWCIAFNANFGQVELRAAPAAGGAAAAAAPVAQRLAPPAGPPPLDNCAPLTGRFRAHWQLDDPDPAAATSIRMALEARIAAGHWMGFGMNSAELTEVVMPGSDVVVAGVTADNKGFAMDYYLNDREQCNYATGGDVGVCPDNSQLNSITANNVRMLSYSNTGGVIRVEFTRPLNASDRADRRWIVAAPRPITWAMGPLSEASTAATPIVLYHQINGEAVNAPADFRLHLGESQFDCNGVIGGSSAREVGGNVTTLANVTVFNVTTGPNPNYPSPPAWGLSYHLNGNESPLIRVLRGTEYTFNVMASTQHPFYLTTSSTGGAGKLASSNETVFAGGARSFGTPAQPYALTWTPNATTPDSLYYQCNTHQKLGWKVEVYDAGEAAGLASNTTVATDAAEAEAAPAAAPGAPPAPAPAPQAGAQTAALPLLAAATSVAAAILLWV